VASALIILAKSYGPSVFAFALFAVLHSIGAREPCKRALARWLGPFFVDHFWRLVYCGLSFAALYWAVSSLHWARNPAFDVRLVTYPPWLWAFVTTLHLGSVAVVYVAFLQSDYLEFLGLSQAWRGVRAFAGRPAPTPMAIFGSERLVVDGIYAWVRHPMLAGGLWFLLTSGPSLNNIVYTLMYALYMVIGGHYEERRLIRIFGDDYRRYRERVGGYFPRPRRPARRPVA
jgi:methanethiol S-methyltransferase